MQTHANAADVALLLNHQRALQLAALPYHHHYNLNHTDGWLEEFFQGAVDFTGAIVDTCGGNEKKACSIADHKRNRNQNSRAIIPGTGNHNSQPQIHHSLPSSSAEPKIFLIVCLSHSDNNHLSSLISVDESLFNSQKISFQLISRDRYSWVERFIKNLNDANVTNIRHEHNTDLNCITVNGTITAGNDKRYVGVTEKFTTRKPNFIPQRMLRAYFQNPTQYKFNFDPQMKNIFDRAVEDSHRAGGLYVSRRQQQQQHPLASRPITPSH
jgi:hypothetical protein